MKFKLLLILILSLLFIGATEFAPGIKGMFSNADFTERPKGTLPKTVNISQSRTPGALQLNHTLVNVGYEEWDRSFYKSVGYYDGKYDKSVIFGFSSIRPADIPLTHGVTAANGADSVVFAYDDDQPYLVEFYSSPDRDLVFGNTGDPDIIIETNPDGVAFGYHWLMSERYGIDACETPYGVIFSDGLGLPILARSVDLKLSSVADGSSNYDDNIEYYNQNIVSLSATAPGQLKAQTIDDTGLVDGLIQYRLAYYFDLVSADSADWCGVPSLASPIVKAENQNVLVTCFENRPYDFEWLNQGGVDSDDSATHAILIKNTDFANEWYVVDTLHWDYWVNFTYVDSSDNTGHYNQEWSFDTTDVHQDVDSIPIPGQLIRDTTINAYGGGSKGGSYITAATGDLELMGLGPNDTIYMSYSYYDPISGAESDLAPLSEMVAPFTDIVGSDTYLVGVRKSFTHIHEHYDYIRFYRSAVNDSTILYGMWQLRANRLLPKSLDNNYYEEPQIIFPQYITTANVIAGNRDSTLAKTTYTYGDNTVFFDGITTQVRPPYSASYLQVVLSDLEWVNFRLWGIGDPLFPARLYHSEYDEIFNWSVSNYLDLNVDGQFPLVALNNLSLGHSQVLYAFKHNSIYRITGYDPVHDLVASLIPSHGVGLLNRRSMIRSNNMIYFMSPKMDIYSLDPNGALVDISQPIDNWVDSIFINKDSAFKRCFAFQMGDDLIFADSGNTTSLVYDLTEGVWNLREQIAVSNITGSFPLNISADYTGYDNYDWIGYKTGATDILYNVSDSFLSRTIVTGNHYAPLVEISLPYIGDGENHVSIESIKLTATFADSMLLHIVTESYDTMATSVLYPVNDSTNSYEVSFADNISKYLSVNIGRPADTGSALGGVFILHDYTINSKKVASNEIK